MMRIGRWRWHGHVERIKGRHRLCECTGLVVGKAPVGRPRKNWQNTQADLMHQMKVDPRTSTTERN